MVDLVKVSENPTIADIILFDLLTPDANGTYTSNPYKVDNLKIFYVERNFNSGNIQEYNSATTDTASEFAAQQAEIIAAASPTAENLITASTLRAEANSKAVNITFYYNDAKPVAIIGTSDNPAWLSTDPDIENSRVKNVPVDDEGATIYGHFQYEWNPVGMREGDYFICWTWTPNPAGDSISSHFRFTIGGATQLTTSIPTHFTNPEKYNTLLNAYLPSMFKEYQSDSDISPDMLQNLNKSVAQGFTYLEDMTNQIVDLLDANSTHESLLPLLSNLFGLKLKSGDPTLWRRQIKRAIPLYKKKGTRRGLEEALAQAGIRLINIVNLWQVISPYTWQELFEVTEENQTWELKKVALPIDEDNFSISFLPFGDTAYIQLSSDYVYLNTNDGVTVLTWMGDQLSTQNISLEIGDIIKIMYQYKEIPDGTAQTIENYIRELDLADQRSEINPEATEAPYLYYPKKNMNVRLISETDPLFDIIIPTRHPYYDPVVYGKIRTKFAFSENIYNMEEYNGSSRNSKSPCDIDKDFLDTCSGCRSSKYDIEVEIESLCNDRILECQDVIRDYTPFHSVLNSMSFLGGINEFVPPQEEELEILISYKVQDVVLSGEGQTWFNRVMKLGLQDNKILRGDLASSEKVIDNESGIGYNDAITLFSPDQKLSNIGMASEAILEILSPSANAGTYTVSNPIDNQADVAGISEPLNTATFTFRVSNEVINESIVNIYQDDIFEFRDENKSFSIESIQTLWDVDQGYATSPWKILISDYSATAYNIKDISSDVILLEDDGSLPTNQITSNITYELQNSSGVTIFSSVTGILNVTRRAKVETTNTEIGSILQIGNYFLIGSDQYKIIGFSEAENDCFYILDYTDGDVAGTHPLVVYKRICDNKVGFLSHRGLKLRVQGQNLESSLEILNGHNASTDENDILDNNQFMENFLVVIGSDYYFITDIDGDSPSGETTINLSGLDNYWKTWPAGGTTLNFDILKYTKMPITIPGQQGDLPEFEFDHIDRSGKGILTKEIDYTDDEEVGMMSLAVNNGTQIEETVSQTESVTFTIEYEDGTTETGSL